MNTLQTMAAPVARIMLALLFVITGFGKISAFSGTQAYMESMGVPGALLPLVIALELFGGLAIIVGWQTRIVAFLLAGFSLLSALLFHGNIGDQTQMIMFLKNVAIAGGFLMIVSLGGGAFALDNRLKHRS